MGKLVKQLGNIDRNLHKQDIVDLARENSQAIIESGKYDLLTVYVELKRYETYLKGLIQNLKRPALDKASETGQKSFDYNDARVNISTRTKWDFSVDNEWTKLDQQINQLTTEKKKREKHLKDKQNMNGIVDKKKGEITEMFELPKEIEYGIAIRL